VNEKFHRRPLEHAKCVVTVFCREFNGNSG
jgi:hypothetical protein